VYDSHCHTTLVQNSPALGHEKQPSYVVNLPVTTSTYVLLMDTLLHIQNSLQKN